MKRKSTALLLSLLLLLALCVPALAAIEYGVFYDETEQLGSVELSYAAEQTLPRLDQRRGERRSDRPARGRGLSHRLSLPA